MKSIIDKIALPRAGINSRKTICFKPSGIILIFLTFFFFFRVSFKVIFDDFKRFNCIVSRIF